MSAIDDVIATTRARLEQLRSRGTDLNEQNTKATLIDPVLAALGWDLHNVDEVDREYKRKPQDNPVDYALLLMRAPRLFIEAKALRVDLNDRKSVAQTLGYATVVGVEWCVLTNGDEYRLYNAHAAVDVEEKLFRSVRISDEHGRDSLRATLELLSKDKLGANQLSAIWKAHFIDRQVKAVVTGLLQDPDPATVRLIQKRLPMFRPPEIRDSLRRADVRVTFPSETLDEAPPRRATHRTAAASTAPASPAKLAASVGAPPAPEPVKLPSAPSDTDSPRPVPVRIDVSLADLIAAGHVRPPMRLEVRYKGRELTAEVLPDGRVAFAGAAYDSPSTAAACARMTIIGKPAKWARPPTNGWTFWRCTDPETSQLVALDVLRQRWIAERNQANQNFQT
ncbi:MAG: type I restriction enzyme HsdR N-terminal domain-containing protein [Ardenticatenales bacterium]|nr:type I restriction enzyme HsdR N-terminal domain-containing protein [Ardenticatenales bacterium]